MVQYVWNFAYGSNMGSLSLTERRKIYPVESHPAILTGYMLSFNYKSIPFINPASGTVEKSSTENAACHGVVHKITIAEFDQLVRSELMCDDEALNSYTIEKLKVTTYDGVDILATVFVNNPKVVSAASFTSIPCCPHGIVHPACTKRYLKLLQDGARENNLDAKYIEFLDALPYYDPSLLDKVVMLVVFLSILPFLLVPLLTLRCFYTRIEMQGLRIVAALRIAFCSGAWVVYEYLPDGLRGSNYVKEWCKFQQRCGFRVLDSGGRQLCECPAA